MKHASPVRTLVIPAAGAGTRLYPITHVTPKEMLRLVDKPIAYYLLAEAYAAGIRRVVFITHKSNTTTKKFFTSSASKPLMAEFPGLVVSFIETSERRGDGHAIYMAKNIIKKGEFFAATMGDLLALPGTSLLKELYDVHANTHESVISVEKILRSKSTQYGIIDPIKKSAGLWRVRGIVEKPEPKNAPSNLAMTGKYILSADIFDDLEILIKETKVGEIKLAHALNTYARRATLNALGCASKHYDTGIKTDLFKTEVVFTLAHPELGKEAKKVLRHLN